MVALLQELVEIESPSHDKTAVDRLGARVAEECRRLDGQVTIHACTGTGDLVEAKLGSLLPARIRGRSKRHPAAFPHGYRLPARHP